VKSTAKSGRIGLVVLLTVLAFGAGLGLRLWSDAEGSERSAVVKSLGGEAPSTQIRLVGADPGTLRRPAQKREPATAPAAPRVFVRRYRPAPAAPSPTAEPEPSAEPEGGDGTGGDTFDIEG
jgi:hypothetical protein